MARIGVGEGATLSHGETVVPMVIFIIKASSDSTNKGKRKRFSSK